MKCEKDHKDKCLIFSVCFFFNFQRKKTFFFTSKTKRVISEMISRPWSNILSVIFLLPEVNVYDTIKTRWLVEYFLNNFSEWNSNRILFIHKEFCVHISADTCTFHRSNFHLFSSICSRNFGKLIRSVHIYVDIIQIPLLFVIAFVLTFWCYYDRWMELLLNARNQARIYDIILFRNNEAIFVALVYLDRRMWVALFLVDIPLYIYKYIYKAIAFMMKNVR